MTLRDKAREIADTNVPAGDSKWDVAYASACDGMRAALERALEDTAPMWGGAHIEALIAELEEP